MKTKIEINGIEVEVEFKDDSLSISVEKNGETIEDLMIPFGEEKESEVESDEEMEDEMEDEIKPFGMEEEEDFESEEDFEEEDEDIESEDEEDDNEGGIESFESFLNKK